MIFLRINRPHCGGPKMCESHARNAAVRGSRAEAPPPGSSHGAGPRADVPRGPRKRGALGEGPARPPLRPALGRRVMEGVRNKEWEGDRKGKGGKSVPLALILQFDHWLLPTVIVNPLMGTLKPHSNRPLYSNTEFRSSSFGIMRKKI